MSSRDVRPQGFDEAIDAIDEREMRQMLVRIARLVKGRRPTIGDLSGGGVLLQRPDGEKGILTAEHCLSELAPRRSWLESEVVLLTNKHPRSTNVVGIPVSLAAAKAERGDEEGTTPDIAWLPLAKHTAAQMEAHGAVFRQPWRTATPLGQIQPDVSKKADNWLLTGIHGWFGMQENEIAKRHGAAMCAQFEMVREWDGSAEIKTDTDGWDYADYVFDDKDSPSTRERTSNVPAELDVPINLSEASRGGYSGCPVWRMWKPDKANTRWEYALSGMVIAQIARNEEGERRLRAHREKSIARILEMTAPPYYALETRAAGSTAQDLSVTGRK